MGRACNTATHECHRGCAMDSDCRNGSTCDTASGLCFECATDADCMGEKCNVQSHECVQCLASSDCQQGETCSAGDCRPSCTSDAQCGGGGRRGGDQQFCATDLGVCVECVANSQCGDQGYCQPDHTCGGGN
jgi:Cys-rich repeat protein